MSCDDIEIRNTIFGMKPLKAPGTDGLHAIFYQSQWDIVGPSFYRFIKDIFSCGKIPKEINKTLLVLVLKIDNPTNFKMFHPISLCTMAYKTVTKIIANRLQMLLSQLIGPHQTSFVLGRHIVENIVTAQEVIHYMRRKTGKRGFMAIKINLEKVYDQLSWNFIYETLKETGILLDLIHLVMGCITSARMNILWNEEVTEEFLPSRKIRQGDPISPYIFVLCIERLSHGICRAVHSGEWRLIKMSRNGTPLTHLFFADDLLLLIEAVPDQARVINEVLESFCNSFEAFVNRTKTKVIFFSKNISERKRSRIGRMLGFTITQDLGK